MLISLSIDQIAVIESSTLTLGPALNALTGETGAGKSLVVGALVTAHPPSPRAQLESMVLAQKTPSSTQEWL